MTSNPETAAVRNELDLLRWQFDLACRLAEVHVPTLTDAMCAWEPAAGAWTVRRDAAGRWRADFADAEPDPPPVVTIGWLTWHLTWWWSGALATAHGGAAPSHAEVEWPGSADAVRARLAELEREWRAVLAGLSASDLDRGVAWPWPESRPLRVLLAWANVELTKNVAEIGTVRHLLLAARSSAAVGIVER